MRLTGLTLPILLGALLIQVVTAQNPGNADKPGECPELDECFGDAPDNKCRGDDECKKAEKCCYNGCHYVCMDPVVTCPVPRESVCNCSETPINNCNHDQKCNGKQLCCQDACKLSCTEPVVIKAGKCPVSSTSACDCSKKPKNDCTSDENCDGKKKCCLDDCRYTCKDPAA